MTPRMHRRQFLTRATTAAAAASLVGSAAPLRAGAAAARPAVPVPDSPVARVALGKSGVTCSVVGMGTGTVGVGQASNQTRLGVPEFTRVVRHALDRGVNLFDVADQYGSHVYLREALKGVPRDQYVIQTKTHATKPADARSHIERYRLELGVDYIDILLLHCMQKENWPEENAGSRDYLSEAKDKGLIRAHGVSCHGIDPLRVAARDPWVEVDLARINPEGLIMDSTVPAVVAELRAMHDAGKGVIGMKILGEGRIKDPERIDASLKFALGLGAVDAMVVGFQSIDEVDDLLERAERAIRELKDA